MRIDGSNVTVSLGVAGYKPETSLLGMADLADQALYQAKSEGRDRVVAHPAESAADRPSSLDASARASLRAPRD